MGQSPIANPDHPPPPQATPQPTPQPPLPAALVVGSAPALREPLLRDGLLLWLEQRPQEGGRTTLLARPAARPGAEPVELTPAPWNLRSRVHAYGGGSYAYADGTLVFVHDGDRCLWRCPVDRTSGKPAGPLQVLTTPAARAFADGLIDTARQRWIGVMEAGERDWLVAVPLAGGEPAVLHRPADFCGYACLSPDGAELAWVEWQQPHMPWERSQLWLAEVTPAGDLRNARPVAGSGPADDRGISVFQPLWIGAGELVVASDAGGWWNLQHLHTGSGTWKPLLPMAAEFAMPQWVYGLRTSAWDGRQLIAAACRDGVWELGRVALEEQRSGSAEAWQPLPLPFDDLAGLSAEDGRLAAVASAPGVPQGLLELELATDRWRHSPVAPCPLAPEAISLPEAWWFAGHEGARTHAWFYPPIGGATADSPLLVKGHSGPTGMARRGLSLAIQFWTSRGWGVVDVNYGGSTGFGRAYRERLDGLWGVADVADCAAAARSLVASGRASAARVAIEGGSAGGFTALAALCFTDVFRAAACRYPVCDPAALAAHDHRFEARYLDGLIGPWPQAAATYEARSPLAHADRIRCPVIFFQGLEDTVVPPEQTERMAAALAAHGIPVDVHRFAGEGHGFRDGTVQTQVLEASEAFFRRHFGLPAP
ncbi:prolyl oligopeptidase family serine peptidase [Cyanobium sp. CH-040]|uniref:S9 family peptidase n=1 Tax=Cyanobium sp. CH-040 TaxID=2823708 RepID=UPI0020CF3446|nr:prolyl oligopeptidase family serine peptidase [Cyanobium sp. CH-040]MCP9927280.1 S9 family peptidase [Cyanobium sp. CH-040]